MSKQSRRRFLGAAGLAATSLVVAGLVVRLTRARPTNAPEPGTAGLDRLVLAVNGLHFDALAAGAATAPLVLLLHGFPQFADSWAPLVRLLAASGFRAVAVDQRGYSPAARPSQVDQYHLTHLDSDVLGFADGLDAKRFHLVGHDWGGLLAWRAAAAHPERLLSLSVLSTPHPDAFREALAGNPDQMRRSKYIGLFRAPGHLAEMALLTLHARGLRAAYQGKLSQAQVTSNVSRLASVGALTAALNWYRALDLQLRTGTVRVPSLYIWGDQDVALGETAALATARYVKASYHFERLAGRSHWLLEDSLAEVSSLLLAHLQAHSD